MRFIGALLAGIVGLCTGLAVIAWQVLGAIVYVVLAIPMAILKGLFFRSQLKRMKRESED